ncbi:hypothetical protein [Paenibacillus sp. FSL W7-1287]|uniref:hypothetical protein n=1 Tax=Paenibacillus sp. FSL W7-1287 TaxID=2954538 RepID=UPI0030F701DC
MKNLFMVIIVFCFLQGSLVSQSTVVEATGIDSSVTIRSGVHVTLYDAQLVKDETGNLAAYTIVIHNNSNSTVNLIDYWARIKGSDGKSYVTKLISEDMEKKYVIPKTTTYLTYYAYVDEKEKLSDLKLDLIQWDFGVNNYEKVIGHIKTTSDGTTPYKQAEEININKTLLNVLVSSYKMYSDKQYTYLSFNTTIRNKANSAIDLSTLKFYLNDGKGTLVELSSNELSLKPQERKSFILNGVVANNFVNNNVSLVVMHHNEASAFSVPKATLKLPKLSNTSVNNANIETQYSIGSTTLALTMKESSLSYTNNKATLDSSVVFENKSNSSVNLPDFEFFVKTSEGFLYPLAMSEKESISLLPKIKKEIKLEGEIPQNIKLSTSEIIVFIKGDEGSQSNYLGSYNILVGTSDETVQNTSSSAKYNEMLIEQVSLQRTPNGVNDLLIAEFKITNQGKQGKGKLPITGVFELDGVKLSSESTKLVSLDRLVAVSPGQSYRVIAYTEIPYVQEAEKIVFSMKEQADEGVKDIHAFEVSRLSNAQLLASNQNYVIDTLGGRGEVAILSSSIYAGKQTDLFLAKLQYTNNEKRATIPTQLKGYIENSKQDIVDLDIKNYDTRLLPDGRVIIYVSAQIPKNYEDKKINLYFGEALGGTEEELANVVINPAYTSHIVHSATPLNELSEIPIMQYDLSIYDVQTIITSSDGWSIDTIQLDFNYDLVVRENSDSYSDIEKIVVEYVDAEVASVNFSKSYSVGDQSDENGLHLGNKKTISMNYRNSVINALSLNRFKINVYAEYKDHKKLIATKELQFGTIN